MNITCPHCAKEFEETDARKSPSKERYKWYELSKSYTCCPLCNGRYEMDISIVGALLFCLFMVASYLADKYLGNSIWSGVGILFGAIALFVNRKRLMKVSAK